MIHDVAGPQPASNGPRTRKIAYDVPWALRVPAAPDSAASFRRRQFRLRHVVVVGVVDVDIDLVVVARGP
ncbi:MAG: hypothetical protein ACLP0J_03780 [Solirubrobacteraceae bacterium]